MIALRDYQERGVQDIRDAFRRGRRSIAYVLPTGGGKTVVMSYIAHGAQQKRNRLLILVHRQELVRQTVAALTSMDVQPGIISPKHFGTPGADVQVAMVQTLVRRPELPISPALIFVDEFHHGVSQSYLEILGRFPAAKIIGLTATPQRLDGKGLGSICEELVLGPSVQELISRGFLAEPIYYAPPSGLNLDGVKRTGGDFNRQQAEERVDRPTITGSAVEHYRKLCPDVPAVAFCTTIRHAEHVRDQFNEAGIPAATIDGNLDDASRADRVAALAEQRIRVLVSVDVISEGFDLPAVTAAILLRPTDSLSLHLQQIGRVLRPKPNGQRAIILDHVGNCRRHGLAEEPRTWTLEGRTGKRKAAAAQQDTLLTCPECSKVHVATPECPGCGFVYPRRERKVAETDGTLAQLTAAAILAERARVQKRQEVGRAQTREQLEAIARARGYSPKWVNMMLTLRRQKNFAAKTATFLKSAEQPSLPL